MSWITVIWSMIAAACLTLAAVHLLVWWSSRRAWASLLFCVAAASTAAIAGFELWMMRATTPPEFGTALRGVHVPAFVFVVALVWFVRLYLRAGRVWLAWAVCGLRAVALALNFLIDSNLNFRVITGVRRIVFLGEPVTIADGIPNPLMLVGQASLLLLVIFVADAALTLWRRAESRSALALGGSLAFFTLAATTQAVLVGWKLGDIPLAMSPFFVPVIAAMAYELSREPLRSVKLAYELRESEARMTLAAEAAGIGIWIWRLDGNHIWASTQGLRLFGFSAGDPVRSEQVLERVHPDDRGELEREVRRAIATRSGYAGEFRVNLPDGTESWLSARGRVFPQDAGMPARLVGAGIDITPRKRAEQEILQQRNQLAHLSRVTMLGELSGSLAHELSQPLTAILANAQAAQRLLARSPTDLAEVRTILADIVADNKRAGEIIRRLRLLFRAGEVPRERLPANDLVEDVLRLLHGDLVHHGVEVRVELDPQLPELEAADRVGLQQVMINLVMNACDAMMAMPRADRHLIISTRRDPADRLTVSVSDNGPGIASDMLEHVFAPFYTEKANGLGLGLSVCRTIVTAHGGELWAQSRPEGGATFSFTLPFRPSTSGLGLPLSDVRHGTKVQ